MKFNKFLPSSWLINYALHTVVPQVNISMLSRYLLQIIGSLVFMFWLNPSLTGVLLAVVPIVSLGAVQYGKLQHSMVVTLKYGMLTVQAQITSALQTQNSDLFTGGDPSASHMTVGHFASKRLQINCYLSVYSHKLGWSYLQESLSDLSVSSSKTVWRMPQLQLRRAYPVYEPYAASQMRASLLRHMAWILTAATKLARRWL